MHHLRRAFLPPFTAGIVAALPFQKGIPGELALISLVPFLLLLFREGERGLSPRGAFRAGWYFGLGFFLSLLYWIALLVDSEIPVRGITAGGWIAMSIYLALYPAFAASAIRTARRLSVAVLLAPAAWGITEYVRSLGYLGFPWGSVGYALMDDITLVQIARFGGVHLVGFFVVLVNAAVAGALAALLRGRRVGALVSFGAALLLVIAVQSDGRAAVRRPVRPAGSPFPVAVAQPNIMAEDKWTPAYRGRAVEILAVLTRKAAAEGAHLVVWPETAVPSYVRQEFDTFRRIVEVAEENNIAVLFGYPDAEYLVGRGYVYYNSALLLAATGDEAGSYRKIRLVPFGESLPGQERFAWVRRIDLGQADFTAGTDCSALGVNRAGSFAVTICYEAIFPSFCRKLARTGAQYLVNLTNDAWFGTTAAPHQHAAMARMRCVELGVYLARAANTGISLIADPRGRVVESLSLGERGYAVAEVTPVKPDTFYYRHGDWAVAAEALLAAALLGAALTRSRASF